MEKVKAYTDIVQSKKLAEFLPIESADNYYSWHDERSYVVNKDCPYPYSLKEKIPCWSIAALLEIIRNNGRYELQMYEGGYYFEANGFMTESYFNPIDACVAMIEKLHEQNLL